MACIELYATGKNSFITLKSKDLATCGFQKKFQTHTQTRWIWAQFQKGQPTPCKLRMLFSTHLWGREFWLQIFSLWHWDLLSKFL